jgi:hypothetical protein
VSAESADRVAFGVLCAFAPLRASGGSATRTPCAFASLGGCRRVCLSGYAFVSLGGLVGQLGWQDVRVKVSGSWWFGYGVVVVATFVIGFLGFAVWVLSKVF